MGSWLILPLLRGRRDRLVGAVLSAQGLEQLQVFVDHAIAPVFADNSLPDLSQDSARWRMDQHFEHGLT
jgi:hypothetical protein